MDAAEKIKAIIEPTVEAMGFDLVRVTFGGGHRAKLQVMAERPDGTMTVDDCADLSHELSALLDVEDPIGDEYILEVSSPGLDRPLTRLVDFERWKGFEARVELESPLDGRRRFRGMLLGLEEGSVVLKVEGEVVHLPFDRVQKAKLVMTDELLDAARRGAQSG
jgi:ribosome maturation factor RimP